MQDIDILTKLFNLVSKRDRIKKTINKTKNSLVDTYYSKEFTNIYLKYKKEYDEVIYKIYGDEFYNILKNIFDLEENPQNIIVVNHQVLRAYKYKSGLIYFKIEVNNHE